MKMYLKQSPVPLENNGLNKSIDKEVVKDV